MSDGLFPRPVYEAGPTEQAITTALEGRDVSPLGELLLLDLARAVDLARDAAQTGRGPARAITSCALALRQTYDELLGAPKGGPGDDDGAGGDDFTEQLPTTPTRDPAQP